MGFFDYPKEKKADKKPRPAPTGGLLGRATRAFGGRKNRIDDAINAATGGPASRRRRNNDGDSDDY
jgi:hypothetical protein